MLSSEERNLLVEERVAQLAAITERRNELLREMYQMIRKRDNVGAVLSIESNGNNQAETKDMAIFLDRFDLNENPETGSIANLEPSLFSPTASSPLALFTSSAQSPVYSAQPLNPSERDNSVEYEAQNDLMPDYASSSRQPSESAPPSPGEIEQEEQTNLPYSRANSHPEPVSAETLSAIEEEEHRISQVLEYVSEHDEDVQMNITEDEHAPGIPMEDPPVATDPPQVDMDAATQVVIVVPADNAVRPEAVAREQNQEQSLHVLPISPTVTSEPQPQPQPPHDIIQEATTHARAMTVQPPQQTPPPLPPFDDGPAYENEPLTPVEDIIGFDADQSVDMDIDMAPLTPVDSPAPLPTSRPPSTNPILTPTTPIPPSAEKPMTVVAPSGMNPPTTSLPEPQPELSALEPTRAATPMHIEPHEAPVPRDPSPSPSPSPPRSPSPPEGYPSVYFENPSQVYIIPAPPSPSPLPDPAQFQYSVSMGSDDASQPATENVIHEALVVPDYTLPPLKTLPIEFQRKSKKSQRKLQKEREKNGGGGGTEGGRKDGAGNGKEDWASWGMNRWAATIRSNPVHKKVARSMKCLSTRDWGVAMTEVKLLRTLEQIEALKDKGLWSFRQPKKQRGVGGLVKTHWDYLMDEMKWMRIDFREERKWKLALAYDLSTAVLEWHAAGSLAERIALGIVVLWKRPPPHLLDDDALEEGHDGHDATMTDLGMPSEAMMVHENRMDVDELASQQTKAASSLLMLDYRSDEADEDEEEEEGGKNNGLERESLGSDLIDARALGVEPKTEEMEDDALELTQQGTQDTEMHDSFSQSQSQSQPQPEIALPTLSESKTDKVGDVTSGGNNNTALKVSSTDPVLVSSATNAEREPTVPTGNTNGAKSTASKISLYAPLREQIAYADSGKLFLGAGDLDLAKALLSSSSTTATTEQLQNGTGLDHSPPTDVFSVFPDLSPFGLFDVAPSVGSSGDGAGGGGNGKKKSEKRSDKDDPNKRSEDTTYTKLTYLGKFATCKPTLLGALQPAKRWKNGKWTFPDPSVEVDAPPAKFPEDSACELFDGKPVMVPGSGIMHVQPLPPRKRPSEHLWTTADDALLKSLIDRYGTNWGLVSECFNSSRLTISTDRRSPWDCHERWIANWGPAPRNNASSVMSDSATSNNGTPPPTPTSSGQMTTRGVKRMASTSVSGPGAVSALGTEPKKRRRHALMQEIIRKAAKKRDNAIKASMSQRKTSQIHETHAQYARLPKMTPAELSKMKFEKESRDAAEVAAARKRHDELARQQSVREQAHRAQLQAQQAQQQGQPQPNQQQQPSQLSQSQSQQTQAQGTPPQVQVQVHHPNGIQRPGSAIIPPQIAPQIRSQVNISQQRMSPPHNLQFQQARNYAHPPGLAAHLAHTNNGQVTTPDGTLRAATSSPGQQGSPHGTGSGNNSVGNLANSSPRPGSAQAQPSSQVPGNAVPRPNMTPGPYYNNNHGNSNGVVAGMPNGTQAQAQMQYTQMHTAQIARMQAELRQQQHAAQQAQQQGQAQGNYPPQ